MGDDRRIRDVDADARADGVTPAVQQMLDAMLGSHQVLESVPSIISVKDRDHRILYMNHVVPGHDVCRRWLEPPRCRMSRPRIAIATRKSSSARGRPAKAMR